MTRETESLEITPVEGEEESWTAIENTTFSFDVQNTSTFIIEYAFDNQAERGSYLAPGERLSGVQQSVYIRQRDKHSKVYASITRYNEDRGVSAFGVTVTSGAVKDKLIFPNTGYEFHYCDQSGEAISLVSTSQEDSAGGAGISEVAIEYLDSELNEKEKIVIVAGQTPVLSVIDDCRFIQCMHVTESSANKYSDGDIIAYKDGEIAAEFAVSVILQGNARCSSSMRMVPDGYEMRVEGAVASSVAATADASSQIRIFSTEYGSFKFFEDMAIMPIAEIGLQNGAISYSFKGDFVVTAGAVVGGIFDANKSVKTTMSWFGKLRKL